MHINNDHHFSFNVKKIFNQDGCTIIWWWHHRKTFADEILQTSHNWNNILLKIIDTRKKTMKSSKKFYFIIVKHEWRPKKYYSQTFIWIKWNLGIFIKKSKFEVKGLVILISLSLKYFFLLLRKYFHDKHVSTCE